MRRSTTPLILAAAILALGSVAFVCSPSSPAPPQQPGPPSGPAAAGRRIALADYLPLDAVTDGSVDYSVAVRAALAAAAGGELVLPPHAVRVSPEPGRNWCIRVTGSISIIGTTGSTLLTRTPAVQLLRAEDVNGLVLRSFTVRGVGGDGQGLGHGLVQVTGGRDVVLEDLRVVDADADGIAVAAVEGLRLTGCRVEAASKAALYVNASRGALVTENHVREFGGHRTPDGRVVGIGIQLSSNRDLVCAHNVVEGGTGAGILCNANAGGAAPLGNVLEGNRIVDVGNPGNIDTSSGIRLANGAADRFTQTLVRGNSLRRCGVYGIYVENHDGALVQGNTIAESVRSGIVIATSRDVVVAQNVLLNSGTSGLGGLHQLLLINDAGGALVSGNVMRHSGGAAPATAQDTARDTSSGPGNALVPRRTAGAVAPATGSWFRGDIVHSTGPLSGGPVGWVCVASGSPGVWRAFGAID